MNQCARQSRLAFPAVMLCGLLAATAAAGQKASVDVSAGPGALVGEDLVVCDALDARISRLRPAVKRRADGESLEAWRERVIVEVEVEAALAAEGESLKLDEALEWQERFARRRAALMLRALEDSFAAGISVGPAEVEQRFAAYPERFHIPEKISTSFILLHLPPDATAGQIDEASRRLLEIRAEHAAGERFGALARQYSTAENAARGGAVATSPQGGLIAAYEEVAWALSPGEVSTPFRLPAGMAIVRLENVFPARELSLEEARPGIEQHLAWEEAQARREAALDESRSRWPATVDWPEGAAAPSEVRFDGEILGLGDLGLTQRPPRLRARVAEEFDRLRLQRLAEYRGFAERPPTAQALAVLRESMLVAAALELRVDPLVPEPPEADLRTLYGEELGRFPDPEQRAFEVHFLPGAKGALRPVREEADKRAALWRDGTPPTSLEVWGPLVRSSIGASTSPLLAGIAFSLSPGEISEPVRLERYRTETARFEAEGYVILRLLEIEPASTLPFEAVRDRIASYVTREERDRATLAVRAEIAARLDLGPALERFRDCAPGTHPGGEGES